MTALLVGSVLAVFAAQVYAAWRAGVAAEDVAGALFVERPRLAWVLSFFLHRNVVHFGVNLGLIALLGLVVESATTTRRYAALVVLAAVGSTVGGLLFVASFTSSPVAVYGASGLGYALATYALALPLDGASSLRGAYRLEALVEALDPAEELAVIVGVAAVLHVCLDLATGPYLTPYWANGGHATGALVGLLVGVLDRRPAG